MQEKQDHVNNMMLKKLKVACQLTTEEMLDVLDDGESPYQKASLVPLCVNRVTVTTKNAATTLPVSS